MSDALNVCDACGGTGTPYSNKPCMCRGTGRMDEAARYLREQLVEAEARLEAVEAERDELRATLARVAATLAVHAPARDSIGK